MTSNGLPTPAEVAAQVVTSSDSICTALVKMIRCFVYAYRYSKYKYRENKTISDQFCAEIRKCASTITKNTTP